MRAKRISLERTTFIQLARIDYAARALYGAAPADELSGPRRPLWEALSEALFNGEPERLVKKAVKHRALLRSPAGGDADNTQKEDILS